MTMREYFAAKAMQVVMADGRNHSADEVAQYSYKMADAMLREKSK
jgi:hypothetical protein